MAQLQDRTVIVQEPGSGGGMGLGVMLGLILAVLLGIAVVWLAFGGNLGGIRSGGASGTTPAAGTTTDTTNTTNTTIQTPDIKVPDSITVTTNTPPQ